MRLIALGLGVVVFSQIPLPSLIELPK